MCRCFLVGRRLLRFSIERVALYLQNSAPNFQIVTKTISYEVRRVCVPGLEVDGIYTRPRSTVNDAADPRPYTRQRTHTAGLQGAVQGASLQVSNSEPAT
jgi:hypothetical protein